MHGGDVISSLAQIGTRDHDLLQGLLDDDHTQYLKEKASGGVAGETPEHTHQAAATCGTLDHGLALTGLLDDDHTQYLKATYGSYAGDSTVNRAITHGLGRTPVIVLIIGATLSGAHGRIVSGYAFIKNPTSEYAVTAPTGTNFYVGNATNYTFSMNATGSTYYWVAIG